MSHKTDYAQFLGAAESIHDVLLDADRTREGRKPVVLDWPMDIKPAVAEFFTFDDERMAGHFLTICLKHRLDSEAINSIETLRSNRRIFVFLVAADLAYATYCEYMSPRPPADASLDCIPGLGPAPK